MKRKLKEHPTARIKMSLAMETTQTKHRSKLFPAVFWPMFGCFENN